MPLYAKMCVHWKIFRWMDVYEANRSIFWNFSIKQIHNFWVKNVCAWCCSYHHDCWVEEKRPRPKNSASWMSIITHGNNNNETKIMPQPVQRYLKCEGANKCSLMLLVSSSTKKQRPHCKYTNSYYWFVNKGFCIHNEGEQYVNGWMRAYCVERYLCQERYCSARTPAKQTALLKDLQCIIGSIWAFHKQRAPKFMHDSVFTKFSQSWISLRHN